MASPLTYPRMAGFATSAGQEFEIHLCALVFLRARRSGLEFQLGSNVKGAAALDDIVFRCKTQQEPHNWETLYVQLKHRERKCKVNKKMLTSAKGDFSLPSYFKSYLEIKEAMSVTNETLLNGSFDDSQFVIFTNAKGNDNLGERCGDLSRVGEFVSFDSGKVFSFEMDEDVLKCLEECGDEGGKFLNRLRVFCSQPNANELKEAVKEELCKLDAETILGLSIDRLCDCYLSNVKVWCESRETRSEILHNNHNILLSALNKIQLESDLAAERVRLELCSEQTLQMYRLDLVFENAGLPSLDAGLSVVQCSPGSCRLSLTKLVQATQGQCYVLTSHELQHNKRALLTLWRKGDVKRLVVYAQSWRSELADACFEVIVDLLDIGDGSSVQDIVFLHDGNGSLVTELTRAFQGRCRSCFDEFTISQLKVESIDKLFDKKVLLQGYDTELRDLFNDNFDSASQVLVASSVVAIMESVGPLTVGSDLPQDIGYFVERTLEWTCVKASVFHNLRGTVTIQIKQSGTASTRTLVETAMDFLCSLKDFPLFAQGNKEDVLINLYRSQLVPDEMDGTVYVGPKFPLGHYECNCVGLRIGQDNAITALRLCPSKDSLEEVSFLLVSNVTNEDDVRKLSEFHKSIHRLSLQNGQLLWVQSRGDIEFVRPHFDENQVIGFSPETTMAVEDRLMLVCAEPGMGKSTLMARLAKNTKEAFPHYFVILLALNDYTTLFARGAHVDVLGFLSAASKLDSPLQRSLLKHALEVSGKVIVIADGFDEIAPKYVDECCQLLSSLLDSTMATKIWMTSRNSIRQILEARFSKFSPKLRKFDENDQRSFLKMFWTGKSCLRDEELDTFIKHLLKKTSQAVRDKETNFMGIPLQTQILAEVFEDHVNGSTEKSELPVDLDLLWLLEEFVKKKFRVYIEVKLLLQPYTSTYEMSYEIYKKNFIDSHEKGALCLILSDDELKALDMDWVIRESSEFCKTILCGKEKAGFIVDIVNGKPRFTHRVYAEYFVANWISKHFASNAKLISSKLFTADFGVVRTIMDRILSRNCALHTAVLGEDPNQVWSLLEYQVELVEARDGGGRTALHLAAGLGTSEDREDNVRRGKILDLLIGKTNNFHLVDDVVGCSPLRYADITCTWIAMDRLLCKSGNNKELILTSANVTCENMLRTIFDLDLDRLLEFCLDHGLPVEHRSEGEERLFLRACRKRSLSVASLLIDRNSDINYVNGDIQSPLRSALLEGDLGIARLLYRKIANSSLPDNDTSGTNIFNASEYTNIKDNVENTAMHHAAQYGHSNVISFLVSQGGDSKSRNYRDRTPLHLAALYNHPSTVSVLLEAVDEADLSTRVNPCDCEWDSVLNYAAQGGSLECVKLLVHAGAKLSEMGLSEETPLMAAARKGNLAVVKWLLHNFNAEKEGLSKLEYMHMKDKDGKTAMHLAAEKGHSDVISFLISQGGNTRDRDHRNSTPLHLAAFFKHPTAVKLLLEVVDEDGSCGNVGNSVLNYAAQRGSVECVELLVQAGVKLSQVGRGGETPLMAAAWQGRKETGEWLLNNFDADREGMSKIDFINAKDDNGQTAMHYAAKFGHANVISVLISQEGDPRIVDLGNSTPLHLAASFEFPSPLGQNKNSEVHVAGRKRSLECAKLLVQAGAKMSRVGRDGETPLMAAASRDRREFAEWLLANFDSEREGMSRLDFINVADSNGQTAIHHAAEFGHSDVINFLVSQGSDIESRDLLNRTPVHLATLFDYPDAVTVLLEAGAAVVNSCEDDGDSLLITAAGWSSLRRVKLLVQAGAKLSQVGRDGETSLMAAAARDRLEVVEWLLQTFDARREGISKLYFINRKDNNGKTVFDKAGFKCYNLLKNICKGLGGQP